MAKRKATKKKATKRKAAKKAAPKRKAAKKKTTKRKPAKKTAKRKAAPATTRVARISPAAKHRTKSEIFRVISEHAGLARKDVQAVFDSFGKILAADLSKRGPGTSQVPGLMKVVVKRMPAKKARKGINPFTKEPTVFKAKPARNVVKVRPLSALKSMV